MVTGTSTTTTVAKSTMPESLTRAGVDASSGDRSCVAESRNQAWAHEWWPTWDSPDELVMGHFGTGEGADVC
ncbi:hypothetical protein ABH935_007088 [Catenulispora sp. GAS73]